MQLSNEGDFCGVHKTTFAWMHLLKRFIRGNSPIAKSQTNVSILSEWRVSDLQVDLTQNKKDFSGILGIPE